MDEQVVAVLERAGIGRGRVVRHEPLTGGTYNTLNAVELDGGARLVLKVPPPPGTPALRYECELLRGEALFYELAAEAGVPAPRVVSAVHGSGSGAEPYLLMTHLPGVTWHEAAGELDPAEHGRLRGLLGTLVARLHTVRGPGFGYPAQTFAPLSARWAPAFAAMTGAVLDDAEEYGAWLPLPVPDLRAAFAAAAPVLEEVTAPVLVHFDLWPGNVLLDGPAGRRTISGIIDGERMFWGDPLADFASLSLMSADAESDAGFLAGYGAGGGSTDFGEAALRRIALYRCYLYLIMLTEVVPRADEGEHLAWVREFTVPRLEEALKTAAGDG